MVANAIAGRTSNLVRLLGFCLPRRRILNIFSRCPHQKRYHSLTPLQALAVGTPGSLRSVIFKSVSTQTMATEQTSTATGGAVGDAENATGGDTNKRSIDENHERNDASTKKPKLENDGASQEEQRPYKKKKVAMLMVYSGKGYQGMQKNPGARSIEDDLLDALVKAGVVTQDHASAPGMKMAFQRAARTDKGVSAAGQVCSLKLFIDVDNPIEKINSHLPDQIKVLGFIPTTKGFDSKNATSARTYMYILPTFAFCPFDQKINAEYRATSDVITKVNEVLTLFKGTHNFHNFTSGKKSTDPSARRYITDFHCGEPYLQEGLELAVVKVKGQSFMLHQIRKMIGLTIAIVNGLTDTDLIEKSWGPKKYDIPKAPGLGLVLDKVHYDAYNKRYGSDGIHEAVDWNKYETEIEEFKKKFIYSTIIETEKNENSMLNWLGTLHLHHFKEIEEDRSPSVYETTGLGKANQLVFKARKNEEMNSLTLESNEASKEETGVTTEETVASETEETKS